MSGVITDVIDCPQCGLPAIKSDYYVIGEEKIVCDYCGYSHLKTLEGSSEQKGYGTIHYKKGSNDTHGTQEEKIVHLRQPINIIQRNNIFMDIQHNWDVEQSSMFFWNDDTKSLECTLGKKPMTLDEIYEEQSKEAEYYSSILFSSNINSKEGDYKHFNE